MKIDPVTFEVDASGGTRPVYVWEAPVRVWHWLMAVAMFAMIITGYLIGRPLVSNLGDTWITYDFGYVRMVHFAAGCSSRRSSSTASSGWRWATATRG